jgi:hypothetical protein
MKEKIYTIPVTEVFGQDCECPLCILEKRLEDEYIDYFLGPSLMEPDCRIDTNENGFCRRHFEQLYNRQENRLGLGLMIDTHMQEMIGKLKKIYSSSIQGAKGRQKSLFSKLLPGKTATEDNGEAFSKILDFLSSCEDKCSICNKLTNTMERYIDVIFYLWSQESDFRKVFESKKGFCMKHFKQLLEGAGKYLKASDTQIFIDELFIMQLENLERIQKDVNWFTKKFDYRNNDAPWGTSRDALPRSIQKIGSYSELK